ncbi:hypothetical protein [Nostoc sp. NMS4]|uniref:hypothetical protein n=1 Tax=Nostoc sp. NMS4 TaxID=2815390 RepID=UPI0025ED9D3C|nr:hypothetical protein [Nostoc sp. NMS4]MBN3923589.1 hypothetical protein [Nostoc sp. NMS4]
MALINQIKAFKLVEMGAFPQILGLLPCVRLGSVVALVGMVIGSVALIWFGFLQPKPPVKQVVQTPTTSPKGEPVLDESAELKSRLAFQDQQQQLKVEPVAAKSPSPTLQNKPKPTPYQPQETFSPRTTPASRITPITPVRISQPAPPVVRYISPNPVRYQASTPIRQRERNVDPFQQWSQLASLGQSQIGNSKVAETQSEVAVNTQTPTGLKPTARASISTPEDPGIQTVLIGSKSTDSKTDNLTPGMVGILNRTPVATTNLNVNETKDVALGTSAPGRIIMPMIWDQGGNNKSDRFAIELTKPLTATDGTVALPAGTVLVTKTVAVGKKNNLVSASAMPAVGYAYALIYPDSQGTVQNSKLV